MHVLRCDQSLLSLSAESSPLMLVVSIEQHGEFVHQQYSLATLSQRGHLDKQQ